MSERITAKQRDWQDIARDASKETDPEKLRELVDELNETMESRREYLLNRDGNEQNSLPRSRDNVLTRFRRMLERARKRPAA